MIICLSGFKGSGKDTLAAYLIEKYGAVRTSFADPLKDSVAEEFSIDRASLDDPDRKEKPILEMPVNPQDGFSRMIANFLSPEFRTIDGRQLKSDRSSVYTMVSKEDMIEPAEQLFWTPRALAILKGSTNRSVRSNFWVQKAIERIKNLNSEVKLHVISDLRYRSELSQLKEAFGDEAVFVRINRFKESSSKDPSEHDLDDHKFEHYIDNTRTLEDSYVQLESILNKVIANKAFNKLAEETEKLSLEFK